MAETALRCASFRMHLGDYENHALTTRSDAAVEHCALLLHCLLLHSCTAALLPPLHSALHRIYSYTR